MTSIRFASIPVAGAAIVAVALLAPAHERTDTPGRSQAPDAVAAQTPRPGGSTAVFVPNVGQWRHGARYVARIGSVHAFVHDDGVLLDLIASAPAPTPPRKHGLLRPRDPVQQRCTGAAVRLRFAGARRSAVVPGDRLAGTHSYFLGSDPSRWRTHVPRYGEVRYESLYAGVDVRLYGRDRHLEYDVVLEPGADLAAVEVEVDGARGLAIDGDGALVIDTAAGPLRQPLPVTWELTANGDRHDVVCRYELRGPDRFGFAAPARDAARALVVDPGLVYSSYMGGRDLETAHGLDVQGDGILTITGAVWSADYPTSIGAWDRIRGAAGSDAFVTQIDPRRPKHMQLSYSTFLGGSSTDYSAAVSRTPDGVITITGETFSTDFPTTAGAWDRKHTSPSKSFIAQLQPAFSAPRQLKYATFLGGSNPGELPTDLDVDRSGIITVCGITRSRDFPITTNAVDRSANGGTDVFLTRLDPFRPASQQLVYSTFLGGTDSDEARAITGSASGVLTIAGTTTSRNFPTTPGALQTALAGGSDVFITRLDPSRAPARQLIYSSFLGGRGDEGAQAVACDGVRITIAGATRSRDFPTANAWSSSLAGGADVFVSRLDTSLPATRQLVHSTYFGGTASELLAGLSVDAAGVVTIAGVTGSADFRTTAGAWDTTFRGGESFISRLDPRLRAQQLVYSTFVGGNRNDQIHAMQADANGIVTIAGMTASPDFPTTSNAWQSSYAGGAADAFITRLDPTPRGTRTYGRSSPGCRGPLPIGVTSWPQIGNGAFAITCSQAPATGTGALAIGARARTTPIPVRGAELWLDPNGGFFVALPVRSDATGLGIARLPIANNSWFVGLQLHAQWFWAERTAPAPCPPLGLSASNALEITFQP